MIPIASLMLPLMIQALPLVPPNGNCEDPYGLAAGDCKVIAVVDMSSIGDSSVNICPRPTDWKDEALGKKPSAARKKFDDCVRNMHPTGRAVIRKILSGHGPSLGATVSGYLINGDGGPGIVTCLQHKKVGWRFVGVWKPPTFGGPGCPGMRELKYAIHARSILMSTKASSKKKTDVILDFLSKVVPLGIGDGTARNDGAGAFLVFVFHSDWPGRADYRRVERAIMHSALNKGITSDAAVQMLFKLFADTSHFPRRNSKSVVINVPQFKADIEALLDMPDEVSVQRVFLLLQKMYGYTSYHGPIYRPTRTDTVSYLPLPPDKFDATRRAWKEAVQKGWNGVGMRPNGRFPRAVNGY